jgi:hypothetical protein
MTDVSEATAVKWIEAFQRDQPMYKSFPLKLPNGAKISKFTGVCSTCKNAVIPECTRGTVVWSLPHVVNGNSKLTHLIFNRQSENDPPRTRG